MRNPNIALPKNTEDLNTSRILGANLTQKELFQLFKHTDWKFDVDPRLPLATFNDKPTRALFMLTKSRFSMLAKFVSGLENNPIAPNLKLPDRLKNQVFHDTLFFMSELRLPNKDDEEIEHAFSEKYVTKFLDLVFFLDSKMRYADGIPHERYYESSHYSQKNEIKINHPLGVLDIALGMIDKISKTPEFKDSEFFEPIFKEIEILPPAILFHDFTEDWDDMDGIKTHEEAQIMLWQKLKEFFKAVFPKEISLWQKIKAIINESLNKIPPYQAKTNQAVEIVNKCDNNNFKTQDKYIENLKEISVTFFTKFCDIVHNMFSAHSKIQTEKYQNKYIDFCDEFCKKIHPDCKFEDIIPDKLINRINENNSYIIKELQKRRHCLKFKASLENLTLNIEECEKRFLIPKKRLEQLLASGGTIKVPCGFNKEENVFLRLIDSIEGKVSAICSKNILETEIGACSQLDFIDCISW